MVHLTDLVKRSIIGCAARHSNASRYNIHYTYNYWASFISSIALLLGRAQSVISPNLYLYLNVYENNSLGSPSNCIVKFFG